MPLDFETSLTVLKVLGAITTGVFGVVALLTEPRNDEGRLTKGGRRILAGILMSTFVTVATSAVERYKALEEARQQNTRTEQLLTEIARNGQPITEITLAYKLEIPVFDPIVKKYLERILPTLKSISTTYTLMNPTIEEGLSVTSLSSDGGPEGISISTNSRLWPNEDEQLIKSAIFGWMAHITFNKSPGANTYDKLLGDLYAVPPIFADTTEIQWNRRNDNLSVLYRVSYGKDTWHGSGRFYSIKDLAGSQLALIPRYSFGRVPTTPPLPEEWTVRADQLSSALRLEFLSMTLAQGRTFAIPGGRFFEERTDDDLRMRYHHFTFPPSESDFPIAFIR